jgi:hypothetical protein
MIFLLFNNFFIIAVFAPPMLNYSIAPDIMLDYVRGNADLYKTRIGYFKTRQYPDSLPSRSARLLRQRW